MVKPGKASRLVLSAQVLAGIMTIFGFSFITRVFSDDIARKYEHRKELATNYIESVERIIAKKPMIFREFVDREFGSFSYKDDLNLNKDEIEILKLFSERLGIHPLDIISNARHTNTINHALNYESSIFWEEKKLLEEYISILKKINHNMLKVGNRKLFFDAYKKLIDFKTYKSSPELRSIFKSTKEIKNKIRNLDIHIVQRNKTREGIKQKQKAHESRAKRSLKLHHLV